MTTPTDRAFIAELRTRTDAAVPEMSLDGLAVRTAGRRATRARRWAATGVGMAAVLAAVVVVGGARSVLTAPPALSPASPTQAATAQTTRTLADGVIAATSASGSGSPWSTGLTMTEPDGTFNIDLLAATQADLQEARDATGAPIDHAIRVTVPTAVPTPAVVLAWADNQQAPTGERPWPLTNRTTFRADTSGTNISRIMAGVVPSWLSDAHVVLFSTDGMTDPSGQLVHAIEVPTFADPSGSGARLYVVVTDPRVPPNQGPVGGVVFASPDGTFLDAEGTCATVPQLCTGVRADGLDLRSELRNALTR